MDETLQQIINNYMEPVGACDNTKAIKLLMDNKVELKALIYTTIFKFIERKKSA